MSTQVEIITYNRPSETFIRILREKLGSGTSVTFANPIGSTWFVARVNGEMAGCACVVVKGNTARIKSLVVNKEHRGKKIGRALWDFRMNWIYSKKTIEKITGFSSPFSQPMYVKQGFKLIRRIPRGERGETWYMELELWK